MGIHNLSKVIAEHAASAVKEYEMKNLFGVKVAVDASMSLYQFLIAVRQDGNVLTNADGETTSHLVGLFYRTIRMIEHGIKPVYVFDGKPPTLKRGELAKRTERRDEAQASLLRAREEGDAAEEQKLAKRLVKVTAGHNAEAKQLLRLMGIPVFEAPGEAEAQCAVLTNAGRVFATATDDMDALCFGARVLVRHLCASEARKLPIQEFRLEKVLSTMNLSFDSFIDLCILLGCDYCETIRGIGPKKAFELINKHKRLETVFTHMNEGKPKGKAKASKNEASNKYTVPEDYPFEAVRELFRKPLVIDADQIPEFRWEMPDEEGLVTMLVSRFGFAEDRVRNNSRKLAKLIRTSQQSRIDSFFAQPSTESSSKLTHADASKKLKGKHQDSDSDSEANSFNRKPSAKKARLASSESESEEEAAFKKDVEVKEQKTMKDEPSTPSKVDTSDNPKAAVIDENKNKGANDDQKLNAAKQGSDAPSTTKDERANLKTAEKSSPKESKPEKVRKTVNAFDLMLKRK